MNVVGLFLILKVYYISTKLMFRKHVTSFNIFIHIVSNYLLYT